MTTAVMLALLLSLLPVSFVFADAGTALAGPFNAISLGNDHSAALKTNGMLWTWGRNEYGALGDGTTTDRSTPAMVMADVAAVNLDISYSAVIKTDGTLWTWGMNDCGQLGDGTENDRSTPMKVMDDVSAISMRCKHCAALKTDGTLWTWGLNTYGQLGDGTTNNRSTPLKIMDNVKAVSLGDHHSVALKTDGTLWTWGWNGWGQLGYEQFPNQLIPEKVAEGVVAIGAGNAHSAALKKDGTLWMWGANHGGSLGDGTTAERHTPIRIMDDVVAIDIGGFYSAAIKTDGTLWLWGMNQYGQIGDGTTSDHHLPVKVMDDVAEVSLSYHHTAAVKKDGSLWTWGRNDYGQIGNGTTENSSNPVMISAAVFYTLAFNANGGVVNTASKTVTNGSTYGTLPTPTWTDHTFDGWFTGASGGTQVTSNTTVNLTANQTLYAHWTYSPASYTISFNANGGTVNTASKTVTNGSTYGTLPTPTWAGHTFDGWFTAVNGGTQITSSVTVNLTGNQTLYAHWTKISHVEFTWNRDNWNFNNSSYQGYFSSGRMIDQINTSYRNVLAEKLTNTEYDYIFNRDYGWIYDTWGGSCYGMSSLTLLANNGLLPYSSYQAGATSLYQLSYPKIDMNISSLVTYYQLLQIKDVIQYQYRTVPNRTNKTNINQIISLLNDNETVLLGFKKSGWGGHAILAYGYEYGSYTFNGVTYQGHIKICDPNSSMRYNSNYDIYFNTSSYRWIIPAYSYVPIDSASGAKFNYIGANISEINAGGYLTGSTNHTSADFVARIDIAAASQNRSIVKVFESNGNYIIKNNTSDDIVEDDSFFAGSEGIGMAGYNLYDTDSSYRVTQSDPVNMELFMDYGTCRLRGSSRAGESIVFDKKGLVEINSQSADYEISMTFNDSYPTDWFSIRVSGTNAENVSLEMCPDGYLLSGNNLEMISVETSNRSDYANANFSTSYPSALIFEIDADTIGVSVDTDGNGTYETVIVDESTQSSIDLPASIEDVGSNQAALNFSQNESGKCVVAIYNTDGRMLTVGISDISANAGKVSIPYSSIELPDRYVVKIMLLNDRMIPLYKSLTETRMRG